MQRHSQWVDTSDHQRLYVKTWGEPEQPALVLVHGYPDHQDVWGSGDFSPCSGLFCGDLWCARSRRLQRSQENSGLSSGTSVCRFRASGRSGLAGTNFPPRGSWLGSIQAWEAVTEPKFKGRILSFSTMSGPCLDHAAFWMREQFKQHKIKFFKQMTKSWYIAVFQLPFIAPTAWNF